MNIKPADFMNPNPDAECELPYAGQYLEFAEKHRVFEEPEESFAGLIPDSDESAEPFNAEEPAESVYDRDHELWWAELREYGGEG